MIKLAFKKYSRRIMVHKYDIYFMRNMHVQKVELFFSWDILKITLFIVFCN